MRVSDDRYTRDRQKFDLAVRLIRHEARTYTIRQWTGLSDDRIRKLYRSYVSSSGTQSVARHRGKSPRQAAFFFRNSEVHFQAAQLASLFLLFGLLNEGMNAARLGFRLGSLESGALLCHAYEAYRQLHSPARISFEHAWFLLSALARRDEIGLTRCRECGEAWLRDLFGRQWDLCTSCAAARKPACRQLGDSDPC
ncbi:MAG TPA: hypothetical protein VN815_15915 [Steroidobacteraceae bacterium]|jgi:hypothetical protein|nr:hypothetical protein [Steroidobacteraceae bacterium]